MFRRCPVNRCELLLYEIEGLLGCAKTKQKTVSNLVRIIRPLLYILHVTIDNAILKSCHAVSKTKNAVLVENANKNY